MSTPLVVDHKKRLLFCINYRPKNIILLLCKKNPWNKRCADNLSLIIIILHQSYLLHDQYGDGVGGGRGHIKNHYWGVISLHNRGRGETDALHRKKTTLRKVLDLFGNLKFFFLKPCLQEGEGGRQVGGAVITWINPAPAWLMAYDQKDLHLLHFRILLINFKRPNKTVFGLIRYSMPALRPDT